MQHSSVRNALLHLLEVAAANAYCRVLWVFTNDHTSSVVVSISTAGLLLANTTNTQDIHIKSKQVSSWITAQWRQDKQQNKKYDQYGIGCQEIILQTKGLYVLKV